MTRLADLHPGDTVVVHDDLGLRCTPPDPLEVQELEGRLYVECSEGCHFLDIHTDRDGNLIGVDKR